MLISLVICSTDQILAPILAPPPQWYRRILASAGRRPHLPGRPKTPGTTGPGSRSHGYWTWPLKEWIFPWIMVIFHSYVQITRGYPKLQSYRKIRGKWWSTGGSGGNLLVYHHVSIYHIIIIIQFKMAISRYLIFRPKSQRRPELVLFLDLTFWTKRRNWHQTGYTDEELEGAASGTTRWQFI